MRPRLEPWILYGGAAIAVYFLVRAAKEAVSQSGGVFGGLTDVLIGAPKPAESRKLDPIDPGSTIFFGLSCRWISPAPSGTVTKHFYSRTYPAKLELHNDTSHTIEGLLEIVVDEDGPTADSRVVTTAGPYKLEPGERELVSLDLNTDAVLGTWATATVRLGGELAFPDATPVWFIS